MLYRLQLSLTHITILWWLYQHWSCVSDYQPKSAIESALPVTLLIGSMISHQQLTLEVLKTHWHYYIFQDWKCIQHTIINSFLGLLYCRSGWSDSLTFTHALTHETSLSIALVLPSSLNSLLPHTTHSHFIFSVSKEAISTVFDNFLIFPPVFSF